MYFSGSGERLYAERHEPRYHLRLRGLAELGGHAGRLRSVLLRELAQPPAAVGPAHGHGHREPTRLDGDLLYAPSTRTVGVAVAHLVVTSRNQPPVLLGACLAPIRRRTPCGIPT